MRAGDTAEEQTKKQRIKNYWIWQSQFRSIT